MKKSAILVLLQFILLKAFISAQEWQLFTGPDAVNEFELYKDHLWVTSGSGLTKINVLTGEQTKWNTINSGLPDYAYNEMAIDSNGNVWMGGFVNNRLTRFDGTQWNTQTNINGFDINSVLDLKVTPDGKVWIYGYFGTEALFYYENGQFHNVPAPASMEYATGTLSNIGVSSSSHVWASFSNTAQTMWFVGEYDGSQWIIHDLSSFNVRPGSGDNWISDSDGNVYMLSGSGIGPLFLKYDGIQWTTVDIPAEINDYNNQRRPLNVDKEDRIWLGLWNNTFIRYDGQSWTTINLEATGLTGGHPDGLFMDSHQTQWFLYNKQDSHGSYGNLYSSNGSQSNLIDLSNSALQTNDIINIVIDQQNNKWIGSNSGLIKFNGIDWTLIQNETTLWTYPVAANTTGGVWLGNYHDSELSQFDGVTVTEIDVTNEEGIPYTFIQNLAVDKKGKVYLATGEQEVLVFDHGEVSYLDSMMFAFFGTLLVQDNSNFITLDTFGRLYSMGYSLHRLEDNGIWTNIPLWEETPFGAHSFKVAPNEDIWMLYGLSLPNEGVKFKVYNGITWNEFDAPFKISSYPSWDREGNLWIASDQGLCKQVNNTWQCYNENNSPLTAERLEEFTIDKYNNVWITLDNGGVLLFNENHISHIDGTDLPAVGGSVFRDLNQNGIKDASDTPLALQRAILLPDSIYTFSNYDGDYRFSAFPGDYEVKYVPRENWHIETPPSSYPVTVHTTSVSGLDFIVIPDQEKIDMRLFLNEGFPRCNRVVPYWMSYGNFGTNAEDGEVIFIKDPKTIYIESYPDPTYVSGDTLVWSFLHQLPFATEEIYLELQLPTPSTDDSTIISRGYLDRIYQNTKTPIDSFNVTQWLLCSFDPNDKTAKVKNSRMDGSSSPEDPIQYTIRFQNTGNDTAFTIVIRDTLDANLDLSTLEIIGASHPFETFLKPDGLLEFRFVNILLPDSLINEPGSHGFVSYTIQARQNIPSPVVISNTAHIYFDYNQAVKTNTTFNELNKIIIGTKDISTKTKSIKAYPNPAREEIIIELAENYPEENGNYSIVDVFGRKIIDGIIEKGKPIHLSTSQLEEGIYFILTRGEGAQGSIPFIKTN